LFLREPLNFLIGHSDQARHALSFLTISLPQPHEGQRGPHLPDEDRAL
jgi:hypothetical protein